MDGISIDRSKSLEQLEKSYWPKSDSDSRLTTTCEALRKKPLAEFTEEDLRIMILQEIGLEHLMPIAFEVLQQNPLAEGDLYRGDLLCAVLKVSPEFWFDHQEWIVEIERVLEDLRRIETFITSDVPKAAAEGYYKAFGSN